MAKQAAAQVARVATATKVSADAQLVTSAQSLSVVKTLIQTGIGVITYLRGVFPEECFVDDRIGPDRSLDAPPSREKGTEESKRASREPRGYIRVKHIKRGASKESDLVLDYLEEGVMDAIQRGFLRQLLFAMYLDPQRPRDVVECYTFNFTYSRNARASEALIPELEIRDQLRQLSLGGKISMLNEAELCKGQKTGGMVKRQVQALIKNLICCTQSLSDIKGRRFLSFKLHYNDLAPVDYEPPYFRSADPERDRFTFGTAGLGEVPSATEMGKVDTGFHSVRVALATISGYLPDSDASRHVVEGRRPSEIREAALERVREDAKARPFVWDTEAVLAPSPSDGPETPSHSSYLPDAPMLPIGRLNSEGVLLPLSQDASCGPSCAAGVAVTYLQRKLTGEHEPEDETESALNSTQPEQPSSMPSSSIDQEIPSFKQVPSLGKAANGSQGGGISLSEMVVDTAFHSVKENVVCIANDRASGSAGPPTRQALPDASCRHPSYPENSAGEDICPFSAQEGVVRETQTSGLESVSSVSGSQDSITSFSAGPVAPPKRPGSSKYDVSLGNNLSSMVAKGRSDRRESDLAMESSKKVKTRNNPLSQNSRSSSICECQDKSEDGEMIQCESCSRWRHLACYGYAFASAGNFPPQFVCYRCRIHSGLTLEDTWRQEDEIRAALETLRGLCIFRRTLAIIYDEGLPTAIRTLAQRLEVDVPTASQVRNRLMAEKFICVRSSNQRPNSKLLESEISLTGSSKKKARTMLNTMIVNHSYEQRKLRDAIYFTPESGLEVEVLKKFEDKQQCKAAVSRPGSILRKNSGIGSGRIEVLTAEKDGLNFGTEKNNHKAKHKSPKNSPVKGVARQPTKQHFHPYETRRQSGLRSSKVSIVMKEVEVSGVSWDDWEE